MKNSITIREREILQLMAEGKSSSGISKQLYISLRTVETHRKNIMHKYNAANACNLVYLALKDNLISFTDNN